MNYIEKERSVLDAMRKAQLWTLHHSAELVGGADKGPSRGARRTVKDDARQSPPHWAAFQVFGDWR